MKGKALRKIMISALSIMMVMTMIPPVFGASDYVTPIEGTDNIKFENTQEWCVINKNTGVLLSGRCKGYNSYFIIPETVDGITVTGIGDKAFYNDIKMSRIDIPKSVKTIGENAFSLIYALTQINADPQNEDFVVENGALFSKDKTRLVYYPANYGMNTAYVIPNTVTDLGTGAFSWNHKIEDLTIPGSIKTVKTGTFEGYSSIDISPQNGSKIRNLTLCEGIETIEDNAFTCMYNLQNVKLPDSVTTLGDFAFSYGGTESFYIGKGLVNIKENTFYGTRTKKFEVHPDNPVFSSKDGFLLSKDGKTVIQSPRGVSGKLVIPEGAETAKEGAFVNIEADTISLPSTFRGFEKGAIRDNYKLKSFEVSADNENLSAKDGLLLSKDGKKLILAPDAFEGVMNIPAGVETIEQNALTHITKVTSIVIPSSVKTIKSGSISSYNDIDISIGSGVTSIEAGAFGLSGMAVSVSVDTANPSYKTDKNNSMILTKDGKTLVYITGSACDYYYTGGSSAPDKGEPGKGPDKGEPGKGYPDKGEPGKKPGKDPGKEPGGEVSGLKIPDGIETIGESAFYEFIAANTIILGSDVKTIKKNAFAGCYDIWEIITSDGIKTIEENAMQNCKYLQFVTIGKTLESIGKGAVGGSGHPVEITFNGSKTTWDKIPGSSIDNISFTNHPGGKPDHDMNFGITVKCLAYNANVNGGSGSGDYKEGETVTVNTDPSRSDFIKWASEDVTFTDATAAETTFTMPDKDVLVTAEYKEKPVVPVPDPSPLPLPEKDKYDEAGNLIAELKTESVNAVISPETIDKAASLENKGLAIEFKNAKVVYDAKAIDTIKTYADAGSSIEVKMNIIDKSNANLTAEQIKSIEKSGNDIVIYDISLIVKSIAGETSYIHDFNGGKATITVPYKNEKGGTVIAYRLEEDGKLTPVETVYDSEKETVTWITDSHSVYMIRTISHAEKIKEGVKATKIKASSKLEKGGIRLTWKKSPGYRMDGYEIQRSVKRYSGYKDFFNAKRTTYKNTKALKKGTRYFYRVRGYRIIDGEKVYTSWSAKAYRIYK